MIRSEKHEHSMRHGRLGLLLIKDSDIRILTIRQGLAAVDRGIHMGGAFSAVAPLVALYYGGIMDIDVADPTRRGQDMFVLSKGHAVAAMASVFADVGYFNRSVLEKSRSFGSMLNGHPGPLLPGVHISTGPEGHGMPVAQGFALAGKSSPVFDVFCLTGDGEIQAGMIWEAVQFAGAKRLDNLCVIVDKNEGQLDNPRSLAFPMPDLEKRFESFGWRAFAVDGMGYDGILNVLEGFKSGVRNGKPTAIICNTRKGWGGFSDFMIGHKVELPDSLGEQEIISQKRRREARVRDFFRIFAEMRDDEKESMVLLARAMNLEISGKTEEIRDGAVSVRTKKASPRDKRIDYKPEELPRFDGNKEYSASAVITAGMKVFSKSGKIVSVDADLASTSGLEAGVAWANMEKAVNVGVAESNMMCIGEAFSVLGYNTWISTFCPFFDWRVMRRIAINYQERLEAIKLGLWLSEGHNLDLVFLATAPDFETRTNGATHMGNDDALVFDRIAHIKMIHICCPNQLLGFMKWVMQGNKGLIYARILRAPSKAIYADGCSFDYGKAYWPKQGSDGYIVSSGRGVHEALDAADRLEKKAIHIGVVDMASWDDQCARALHASGKKIFVAEQNNGWILHKMRESLWTSGKILNPGSFVALNCLDDGGQPQFIHSATYAELMDRYGLSGEKLADLIEKKTLIGNHSETYLAAVGLDA